MLYAEIEYHKRYSQVHVIEERGPTCATARLPSGSKVRTHQKGPPTGRGPTNPAGGPRPRVK